MFNYILFDLDNTIYNYDNAHQKAINFVFDKIHDDFKVNKIELEISFKNEKKKYQQCCYRQASSHNKFIQIKKLLELYSLDLSKVNYYYEIYTKTFNESIELYPNVLNFIKFCKSKNIKMYILTNNICRDQLERLTHMNIIHFFEKIYTSEEFGIEKPDIKLFYYILSDIGCNKDEIVKIGDNYLNDIEPLYLNNIYSFWFNCNNNNNFTITEKYIIFKDYTYLLHFFKEYYNECERFLNISDFVGERFDLVQAGGGNTSFKIRDLMFVKSSGCCLTNMSVNKDYVGVNFINIKKQVKDIHSHNKKEREVQSKNIVDSNKILLKKYKPSIETTLHCLTKKYTVHIHPIQFNAISALPKCHDILNNLFRDLEEEYCLINYVTPGIDVTLELLKKYKNENIIFLKNHGLVFTSDNIKDLKKIIHETISKLEHHLDLNYFKYRFVNDISKNLKEISKERKITYLSENIYLDTFINSEPDFNTVFTSFFPDKVVYCGISYCNIDKENIDKQINSYIDTYREIPKIFILKLNKYYLYISSSSINKCREIEQVLVSHFMCYQDNNIFLDKKEINYLNNWDAEKYRKLV